MKLNKTLILTRVSEPTSQDIAPFKSICIVNSILDIPLFYAQFSKDNDKPSWQKIDTTTLDDSLKYIDNL